jgi:hypothetical protein
MGPIFKYIQSAFDLVYISPLISLVVVILMAGLLGYVFKGKGLLLLVGILSGAALATFLLIETDKKLAQSDWQLGSNKNKSLNFTNKTSDGLDSNISLNMDDKRTDRNNENTELSSNVLPTYKESNSGELAAGFLLKEANKSSIKAKENTNLPTNFNDLQISVYMIDDCFNKNFITHLSKDSSIELPDNIRDAVFKLKIHTEILGREMQKILTNQITKFITEYYSLYDEKIKIIANRCHLN